MKNGKVLDIKQPEKKASINSEDKLPPPDTEETDSEPEIKFVCGMVISMYPNGQGIQIAPIQHPEYARIATNDDILMLLSDAMISTNSRLIAGLVEKVITNYREMRRAMNKIGTT